MSELREELTRALRTVQPGHPPVEETMRRGRTIKTRRRAAIVAGALAVAAVAVGYPTLAHQLAAPASPPAQHVHHDPVITDTPPAPGSAAGTVAQGTVGGTRWRVILQHDATAPTVCLTGDLTSQSTGRTTSLSLFCGISATSTTGPADFAATEESGISVQLGAVAPNLAYFMLTFTDGQQLKLIPVTVFGHRYVAFAAPVSMPIASVTAHLGGAHFDNGTTETAIPFQLPGQVPVISAWLRQGQPALPRVTASLGSGTADGTAWRATAYQGPWGICVVSDHGSYCLENPAPTGTAVIGWSYSPRVIIGHAAAGVAYLEITMPDGTVLPKVTPVTVGSARLFAFASPGNHAPKRWTAYSASGKPLSSGSFAS